MAPTEVTSDELRRLRTTLGTAALLNTGIFVSEWLAGVQASSLSLKMDAIHNFSDELALVCIFLASVVAISLSRPLQRVANLLNSVGLITLSIILVWEAALRTFAPSPVEGIIPVVVGSFAASANWGVAKLLSKPAESSATIRLAYLHNLGDIYVSLAPIAAGALVAITGLSIFDPLCAIAVGGWLIVSTIRELNHSHDELIWPEDLR